MNCKHCGAPLNVGDETCAYCGSPTELGIANKDEILKRKERENVLSMKVTGGALVIFLCIITVGLYSPVWYLLRKKSLDRLSPQKPLPQVALWLYLLVSIAFIVLPQSEEKMDLTFYNNIYNIILLAMPGLSIWLAFRVRRMLQTYAATFMDRKVVIKTIAPSGLALVFFGMVYLQLQINNMVSMEILNPEISADTQSSRKRR